MYRIFIVEDDAAIAQAVCEQAESWALEARCVSDFRRVAEEAAAYDPHLILLDISLPFFDGYHWCRQIRRTSRVPIIFLSSAADNMNIVMAMNMGADDFIAKPFDRNVLMPRCRPCCAAPTTLRCSRRCRCAAGPACARTCRSWSTAARPST